MSSKLKSEEQFREELRNIHPNLIPNDIYKGSRIKYHCICRIHNCDVYKTPYDLISRKRGCTLCNTENNKNSSGRYTHDTYVKKLYSINSNIEVLSQYMKIKDRINVRCKVCGYEWNPTAESLIRKNNPCGCPSCAGNAIITPDEFKEKLTITHPYLELLNEYVRSNLKVHVYCKDCGNDFLVTPNKLQQGQQCFCKCESHGEFRIRIFLESHNINFERYKKYDGLVGVGKKPLSYDFYLPDFNLLVEFQGKQHEAPYDFGSDMTEEEIQERFKCQQEHDRRKRNYALDNNIELLEIWYWDLVNIENILSNKLNSR